MWREALAAWLRERSLPARAGIGRAWRLASTRPEATLAVALLLGVFVMILHWS